MDEHNEKLKKIQMRRGQLGELANSLSSVLATQKTSHDYQAVIATALAALAGVAIINEQTTLDLAEDNEMRIAEIDKQRQEILEHLDAKGGRYAGAKN